MKPESLRMTARLVYFELKRRGIDPRILSENPSLITFAHNEKQRYVHSVLSDKENALAYAVAQNKALTAALCEHLSIPHPHICVYENIEQASAFQHEVGTLVVKPLDGAHGNGVTLNVTNTEDITAAVTLAQQYSDKILLQQMVAGEDYRIVFIGGEYAAAINRIPASVIGDGEHTLAALIAKVNEDPSRGPTTSVSVRKHISLPAARQFLGERYESEVPAKDVIVRVVGAANIGTGGTARDVTAEMPEGMIAMARKIVHELNMGICAVDFMWDGERAYLIELNATPGIDIHDDEKYGQPQGVITKFVDYLLASKH